MTQTKSIVMIASLPILLTILLLVINIFGAGIPLAFVFAPIWVPIVFIIGFIVYGVFTAMNAELRKQIKKDNINSNVIIKINKNKLN